MRSREEQLPIASGPDWDLELGALDPEIRAAADLLRRTAIRYQPSFRFQEALAARLRAGDVADTSTAAITVLPVAGPLQAVEPLQAVGPLSGREPLAGAEPLPVGAPLTAAVPGAQAATIAGWNRSLLVGGAIASGVSLAGAIVAWRLGRLRQGATGSGASAVIAGASTALSSAGSAVAGAASAVADAVVERH